MFIPGLQHQLLHMCSKRKQALTSVLDELDFLLFIPFLWALIQEYVWYDLTFFLEHFMKNEQCLHKDNEHDQC
jgi:hypothetical protein